MKQFKILTAFLLISITNLQFTKVNTVHIESESFLEYTIIKNNKVIGMIQIKKTIKNDIAEYLFESNAKASLLFYDLKFYDKMRVTFKQNILQQAKLYRTTNGKVEVNNITTWNGSYYNLLDKNGGNGIIKHLIPLTTACLYFFEPVNESLVFSERFQSMLPLKKVGNSKYMLSLPNGNKTTYFYLNGVCSLVEADTGWASLKFILKTNK